MIGLLGVLVESRQRQLIASVRTLLDRLEKEAGFWVSPGLRAKVLQSVGE
ncbi:MAG TPA: DUF3368 domain-containing protein [Verrucomicrobiae bacterium]|nr:DUF3368 domain-containing protein [Verrucomicrobiae bacterium]